MKRLLSRMGPGVKQALNLTGMNSIFWFAWAIGCYQTVYLQSVGFTASKLGVVNAMSSAVAIASVSFWGMVSDKIGSVRKVLMTVLIGGGFLFSLIPAIPTGLAISPLLLTCLLPAVNFFRGSMATFTDNLLIRNCSELHLNFGVIRSGGSLTFAIGSVIISLLIPTIGVQNTFWIHGLFIIPTVILVFMAREPNAKVKPKSGDAKKSSGLNLGELFRNRAYVVFLFFAFIFYIAVNCEASFIPYFMESIGLPSGQYGIILAYRALLEIPLLLLIVRLKRKIPLRYLIMAAAGLMALECIGLGLFSKSLPTMLLFCTFFGLGNGLFIGSSLNYVYELAPDHLKASAQAFFVSVSSVAGIVGNLLGGMVFDAIGAKPFYLVVAGLYILSAVIFFISILKEGNNQKGNKAITGNA